MMPLSLSSAAPDFTFYQGDALEVLQFLPSESVHSIVVSPPYFRQRDYGIGGQIGREKTPDAYLAGLVAVFAEARRVLRTDGNLWLNIGDSYHDKQLQMIPARLALALQADSWILRGEQVWDKPNSAPESVKDRPSRSHEFVFLFSRSPHYFYDREATRVPNQSGLSKTRQEQLDRGEVTITAAGTMRFHSGKGPRDPSIRGGFVSYNVRGRQMRSVFRVPIRPFHPKSVGVEDVDHFAVMSPDLAEICIRAGTPEGGVCSVCGKPRRRVIGATLDADTWEWDCQCEGQEIAPAVVLDPFGGAGTTLAVASELGRRGIYIDLNPDYLRLARARIQHAISKSPKVNRGNDAGLLADEGACCTEAQPP